MKVWDGAEIKLATPGSADRLVTNCAKGLSKMSLSKLREKVQANNLVAILFVAWDGPFCENYLYVLSHGVTTLKWPTLLISISACGDGNEMGVSFNR